MECKIDFRKVLNIKEISENINFWLVRSKSGLFYDEYKNEKYIGLGWNYITDKNINETDDSKIEAIKDEIKRLYKTKQPTTIINKCDRFINEMKKDDIVMIPSAHNNKILFAKIGDYFTKDISVEKENEIISRIDSSEYYGFDEECPYSKRRHIEIITEVDGSRINPNLYKALASYHGLSKINKYAEFILRSIYILYVYKNKLYFVVPIEKKDSVNSRTLAKFILNTTDILESTNKDITVTSKIDLNSPGDYLNVINHAVELLSSDTFLASLTAIITTICTSKFGPDIIKSVLSFITDCKKHNLEKEKFKFEKEKFELEKEKVKSQLESENLDKQLKIAELQEKLISLGENTQELEVNESHISNVINFNELTSNHSNDEN